MFKTQSFHLIKIKWDLYWPLFCLIWFVYLRFSQTSEFNVSGNPGEIGYLDFMDMHQWFWVSRNDVNVNRDDVDRNFAVHAWQVEHTLNIVWIIQYRIKFVLT